VGGISNNTPFTERYFMTPWVPPYFGSYQQLLNELLHNPFLGSGGPDIPVTHREDAREGPVPSPWRSSPVISYLGTLVSMQELSKNVANPAVAKQLAAGADAAFAAFLDDYCGTPPRHIPWPWPVAGPWVIGLASELVSVANTYPAGAFREGLLNMAGRIAEKALATPALSGAATAR
jgi:hypothetical protein